MRMVDSEGSQNSWVNTMDGHDSASPESTIEMMEELGFGAPQTLRSKNGGSDGSLGIGERAFSAAGAAFLSAIIVNPLDVAKVRKHIQKKLLFLVCWLMMRMVGLVLCRMD